MVPTIRRSRVTPPAPRAAMRRFLPFLLSTASTAPALLATATAHADPAPLATAPHPHAYAVVVGSNAAGAGQQALHLAQEDAQRMRPVLRDLGRFDATDS